MKNNHRLIVITLAAALALPSVVFAAKGEKKEGKSATSFAACDTNNDGFVSKEEYVTAMKNAGKKEKGLDRSFAAKDKDSDGKLSKEEFAAKVESKKKTS